MNELVTNNNDKQFILIPIRKISYEVKSCVKPAKISNEHINKKHKKK